MAVNFSCDLCGKPADSVTTISGRKVLRIASKEKPDYMLVIQANLDHDFCWACAQHIFETGKLV